MRAFTAGVLAGLVGVAGFLVGNYDPPDERDPFADLWTCANFDGHPSRWSDLLIDGELIRSGGKSISFPFQCSTMDGVRHFSEHLTLGPEDICAVLGEHQPDAISCVGDVP